MPTVEFGASRPSASTVYEPRPRSQTQAVQSTLAGCAAAERTRGPRYEFMRRLGGFLSSLANRFRPSVPQGARLAKSTPAVVAGFAVGDVISVIRQYTSAKELPENVADVFGLFAPTALRLNENDLQGALHAVLNQISTEDLTQMREFLTGPVAAQARGVTQNPATDGFLGRITAAVSETLGLRIGQKVASDAVDEARAAVEHDALGARVAQLLRQALEGATLPLARLGLPGKPLEQTQFVCNKLSSLEPQVLSAILRHAHSDDLGRLNQAGRVAASVRGAVAQAITERTSSLACTLRDQARSFCPSHDPDAPARDAFVRQIAEMAVTLEELKAHCAAHDQPDPFPPGQMKAITGQIGSLAAAALRPGRIDPQTLSGNQLLSLSKALRSLDAYEPCSAALREVSGTPLPGPDDFTANRRSDGAAASTAAEIDYYRAVSRAQPYLCEVLESLSARYSPGAVTVGSEDEQRFRDAVARLPSYHTDVARAPTGADYATELDALDQLKAAADGWVATLVDEVTPKISALAEAPAGIPLDRQAAQLSREITEERYPENRYPDLHRKIRRLTDEISRLPKSTAHPVIARQIRNLTSEVSALSIAVRALAIIERTHPLILRALSADQHLTLLAALTAGRKPKTQLPHFLRGAQAKLYGATSLDPGFLEAQRQQCKAVVRNLLGDQARIIRLTRARNDWPTLSRRERLGVLELIVRAHSAQAGIEPPARIRAEAIPGSTAAGWATEAREIIVNVAPSLFDDFEAMIECVFHENSHNYQDALSGRGGRNDVGCTAERAKFVTQIKLFAANIDHYLHSGDSYRVQPIELHAFMAGRRFVRELSRALLNHTGRA